MARTMKAAYLYAVGKIGFEDIPIPEPAADEALVRVAAVGVCGSDVHYYEKGKIGPYVVKQPLILGHECGAVVAAVGKDVTNVKEGDRVAIEPGVPCRRCEHCRSGRYNLCSQVVFLATPPVHGAFTEYLAHAADFLYPIPDAMSLDEAAMIEPLSVGMHGAKRARVSVGDTVAVLGSGPIGLMAAQSARAYGAATVICIDIQPGRLAFARKLGADHVVDARQVDPVEAVMDITKGRGVDVTMETAGAAPTARQSIQLARRGGRVVWIGLCPEDELPLPYVTAVDKELDITTVFRYANCYPPAISLVAAGAIDVKSMITGSFPLEQVQQALDLVLKGDPDTIKVMVDCAGGRGPA